MATEDYYWLDVLEDGTANEQFSDALDMAKHHIKNLACPDCGFVPRKKWNRQKDEQDIASCRCGHTTVKKKPNIIVHCDNCGADTNLEDYLRYDGLCFKCFLKREIAKEQGYKRGDA